MLKLRDVRLKINTVVTQDQLRRGTWREFIANARPERWKLFQVLPVRGQNDGLVDSLVVTRRGIRSIRGAQSITLSPCGIVVVPESNDLMTGSYVMVDPAGRFFDNVAGAHVYSRPINQVGVDAALREVSVDSDKFQLREGLYDWRRA